MWRVAAQAARVGKSCARTILECRLVGQLIWIRRPNACTHVHRHSGSIANQLFYSTSRFTTPRHMKPRPRLLLLHPFSGTAPSPIAIHCPLSIIIMIVIAQGTCAGAQMLTLIVITVHHCFCCTRNMCWNNCWMLTLMRSGHRSTRFSPTNPKP